MSPGRRRPKPDGPAELLSLNKSYRAVDEERLDKLKAKYTGETARTYEDGRKPTEHWHREQRVVSMLLERSTIQKGSLILDVPVGTGRFFPFYKKHGYRSIGIDASPDMLAEAEQKASEIEYSDVELMVGDILDLPLADDSAALSVCIRLLNWFDFSGFQRAVSELRRVSTHELIVGVRLSSGRSRLQLSHVPKTWKKDLKDVYGWARRHLGRAQRSLQQTVFDANPSEDGSSDSASSSPTLVDHSEEAVRREFQKQGLPVIEEKHVLLFTSEPQLSNLYTVEELPYRIFRLHVGDQ